MADILLMPNHVANPAFSRRMVELTLPSETQLMWIVQGNRYNLAQRTAKRWGPQWWKGGHRVELWPAYTVAELTEMLVPSCVGEEPAKEWLITARANGNWVTWIDCEGEVDEASMSLGPSTAPTFADTLAELLIARAIRESLSVGVLDSSRIH